MVVGVAQIERLADEVVRGAGQLDPVADRVLHPAGQVAALGHEQREVEEPGVPVGGTCARLLDQVQQIAATRTQARLTAADAEHVEPDRLGVVRERPREICHGEVDGTDGGCGGDHSFPG